MAGKTLSVRDVAEFFGCCETTIRRRIRDGQLEAVKFGRSWRIERAAVARLWARLHGAGQVGEFVDSDHAVGLMFPPGVELDDEARQILSSAVKSSTSWREIADELFGRGIPAVVVNADKIPEALRNG